MNRYTGWICVSIVAENEERAQDIINSMAHHIGNDAQAYITAVKKNDKSARINTNEKRANS